MTEFRTWRELLGKLIGNPVTKQFIVTNSKLHPTTLQRWADGVHNPYGKSLKLLLQSIPPEWQEPFALLVSQEFPSSSPFEEFYEPSRIALAIFPSWEQQQPLFATFQQRLARVRQASPTSLSQAELQVWQQIEAELIAHPSLFEQERSTEL